MSNEQLFTPDRKTAGYLPFIRGRRGGAGLRWRPFSADRAKGETEAPPLKKEKIAHGSMIEKAGT